MPDHPQPTETSPLAPELEDWRHTFDAITELVAVLDGDFRIRRINQSLQRFLGQRPEEVLGRHCYEVLHNRSSPWPGCPHAQMLERGETVTLEVDAPNIGLPLLVTATPIFDRQGRIQGSIHIARDLSQIKQSELLLGQRNEELMALHAVSCQAMANLSLQEVTGLALDTLMRVLAPDQAFIYLREGDSLLCHNVRPAIHFPMPDKKRLGDCLCGLAAKDRQAIYSTDIQGDPRCTLPECKLAGVRSFAALPLVTGNELLGVLGLASLQERRFEERGHFLETMAATTGLAIKKTLAFQQLAQRAHDLENLVRERTRELTTRNLELERMNSIFVDREFRIKELRDEISQLKESSSRQGEGSPC